MTINNKSERNYRGKCLGWPVTSYGAGLDVANEIFYSVTKNANLMVLETARLALTRRNIKWLLTRPENHFKSNQICFYSNLGKVFQLPEFQAKLFFKRV